MPTTIRRVRADEAAVLRSVRLAALADAPTAFASRHADEAALPAEEWERRASQGSEGHERTTFLAVASDVDVGAGRAADGAVVGLVVGFRRDGDSAGVELVSMWTAPAVRRHGVALALVEALVGWAAAGGASEVGLWVMRGNDGARRLYERAGFAAVPTDPDQVAADDACRDEIRMRRGVTSGVRPRM